jgi:hypothetical protein
MTITTLLNNRKRTSLDEVSMLTFLLLSIEREAYATGMYMSMNRYMSGIHDEDVTTPTVYTVMNTTKWFQYSWST